MIMPKVAGLGEVLWDIYPDSQHPGGAPANFSGHVTQAGCEGYLMSRIGNDELGRALRLEMEQKGIVLDALQTDATHATGTVKVVLDANGVPAFECSRDVAFDYMQVDASWKALWPYLDAILWGTLAQRNHVSRLTIQHVLRNMDDAIKVFDINLRGWNELTSQIVDESLHLANIIKLNQDELEILKKNLNNTRDDVPFLRFLLQKYQIKLAAVTFGENGSLLVTNHEHDYHPGFKVNVVDTTGSGDAFAAGMLVKYLDNAELTEISDFANRLGAFVATRQGAVPAWTPEDLMRL